MAIDTGPLIRAVDDDRRGGASPAVVARRFHTTLADVVRNVARILRARTAIARVGLSGGVFLNAILTVELETRLSEDGFEEYRHRGVSPGEGGLSLGQPAVASARLVRHTDRWRRSHEH